MIVESGRFPLDRHRDLSGICSIGAGNSGIIQVLDEYDITSELLVLVHELSEDVRAAPESEKIDVVLVQNAGSIARSSVRLLCALHCRAPIIEDQENVY